MRYWVYLNGEVPGAYTAAELAALPGFTMTALVCPAQGEIAEKNWRRAGEFTDIAQAFAARPPSDPAPQGPSVAAEAAAGSAADVDAMIDTASTRLFSHVADLMKELETRREEKALIASLQKQVAALKDEIARSKERADLLEMRLPRIAELEETTRKQQESLQSLQSSLQSREQGLNEARVSGEKLKNDLESTKRRLQETANDLAMRNRLVDRLSKDLSEKELSLAKALGVIRRFEEDLGRLSPDPAIMAAAEAARASLSAPPPAVVPLEPRAPEPPAKTGPDIPPAPAPLFTASDAVPPPATPYTLDEPPTPPPYLEPQPPAEGPQAQQALVKFLKRIFPGQPH